MLGAEADKEACIDERTQLLGFATKAVEHPGLLGVQRLTQVEQAFDGFYAMDDERLPELFAQADLPDEDFFLHRHRRPLQRIETAFPDGKELSQTFP